MLHKAVNCRYDGGLLYLIAEELMNNPKAGYIPRCFIDADNGSQI